MSFQNRAGTIVLDAILTDTGRKRMAQGKFNISKFSLGDDEVDYALYNNVAASITDDEDALILPTPILEAFNAEHANINFGLISYASNTLFYIPELHVNNLVTGSLTPPSNNYTSGIYYLAANDETHDKLQEGFGDAKYIARNEAVIGSKIIVESGLYTEDMLGTKEERDAYILNNKLLDRYFNVYCDGRYITAVAMCPRDSKFKNYEDGSATISFDPLVPARPTSMSPAIEYYTTYIVKGIDNLVWSYGTTGDAGIYSVIPGARAAALAINFSTDPRLTTTAVGERSYLYSVYGDVAETLHDAVGGIDHKYDFIETTIYIEGITSGARTQVPLRITRYAGT